MRTSAVIITVDNDPPWHGSEVRIGGVLIGYRPYDGSDVDEILAQVNQTLADMLHERLGWPRENPDEKWYE